MKFPSRDLNLFICEILCNMQVKRMKTFLLSCSMLLLFPFVPGSQQRIFKNNKWLITTGGIGKKDGMDAMTKILWDSSLHTRSNLYYFNEKSLVMTQTIMTLFKLSLRSVYFEQFHKSWDGKICHLFLSGASELIKSNI